MQLDVNSNSNFTNKKCKFRDLCLKIWFFQQLDVNLQTKNL